MNLRSMKSATLLALAVGSAPGVVASGCSPRVRAPAQLLPDLAPAQASSSQPPAEQVPPEALTLFLFSLRFHKLSSSSWIFLGETSVDAITKASIFYRQGEGYLLL